MSIEKRILEAPYMTSALRREASEELTRLRNALAMSIETVNRLRRELTPRDAVDFMCIALRHAEYKRGTGGPTVSEIMDGFDRIGLPTRREA